MDRERAEVGVPRTDDRSPEEIRRTIETTRTDMHETVEALERKLSPGQLLDEVWGRVRSGSGGGSTASSVGDVIRDHPVPLALMGLGVAWLAMEKAGGPSPSIGGDDVRPGTYGRAEGRVGPYRGDAVHDDGEGLKDKAASAADAAADSARSAKESVKDGARSALESVKDAAGTARDRVSDAASSATDSARDAGSDLGDRASTATDEARDRARWAARKTKRGFWRAMDEQPLAMAAVAFGLGVAGGLSAPTTDAEDRAMGDASDALKERVKEEAKDVASSAKAVAKDAAEAAKEEARRQDIAGDASDAIGDLKDSAARVAAEAKETAKARADEEDLDGDGLKDRAEKATDDAQRRLS